MTDKEKNEIKNRLSDIGAKVGELALEYIIELEKENEDLKNRLKKMKCCENCKHNYYDFEKENAELKKENTELKIRWQCRNKYVCNKNGNIKSRYEMRIGTYAAIERIDFIREGRKFTLEQYMRRFEISRRTAYRDFTFIKNYRRKPLYLKCTNGE